MKRVGNLLAQVAGSNNLAMACAQVNDTAASSRFTQLQNTNSSTTISKAERKIAKPRIEILLTNIIVKSRFNNLQQTPTVVPSQVVGDNWKTWKLK